MARTRSKRGEGSAKRYTRAKRRRISKLRQAAGRAAAAVEASRSKPMTLEGFAMLPYELKSRIIKLACSPTTSPEAIATNRADLLSRYPSLPSLLPPLDYSTALSLALASQALYGLIAPLLYRQVWLNRPSSLASFHLALTTRPALGQLVKSFHVGPDTELSSWDPLHYLSGYRCGCGGLHGIRPFMSSSLQSISKEAELLPRWCQPSSSWPVDSPGATAQSRAVFQAVRVAQEYIDVDFKVGVTRSFDGRAIEEVENTMRCWEVQAALDLYLVAVRRWEDVNGISIESSSDDESTISEEESPVTYPTLLLMGYSTTAEDVPSGTDTIVLSRSDLLRHLARRRSPTDHFNHPLIFARVGLDLCNRSGAIPHQELIPAGLVSASDWSNAFSSFPGCSADYSLPNTATIASNLATLRAVLAYCPLIENLSLAGSLERVICGSQSAGWALSKLRYLSVGPAPLQDIQTVPFDGFADLEELRVCGTMLHPTEVEEILTKMPRLRRLEWSLAGRCADSQMETLQRSIAVVVGSGETGAAPTKAQPCPSGSSGDGLPSSVEDVDQPNSNSANGTTLLVVIKLMYCDLETILNKAPSPAVRDAWRLGRAVPGQRRRLQLGESPEWGTKYRSTLQEAYFGVRQWWEARRAGRRESERD